MAEEKIKIIEALEEKPKLKKKSLAKIKSEFFKVANGLLIACFLSFIVLSIIPAPLGFKILALLLSQAFIFDLLHSYKFLIKSYEDRREIK